MESRVSQQSNSLDTTRTSQLITMVNELLMPLAMNHSNSSGTFEEYTANKRYTRNNITSRAYALKTGILADRFCFSESSPRTKPAVENHLVDQVAETRNLEVETR